MIYLELFLGFLKVGIFAFGGAYGAISLIREVVFQHQWLTDDVLSYMIAVSESTPGPITINLATYVGSSQGGFWGAVIATGAVTLPAFLIIILVKAVMSRMMDNPYVKAVLRGMTPCIIGIILATGAYMLLTTCFHWENGLEVHGRELILTLILAGIMAVWKKVKKRNISPILLILISAVLGIFAYL